MYVIMDIGVTRYDEPCYAYGDNVAPAYFVEIDSNVVFRNRAPNRYSGYEVSINYILETIEKQEDQCAEDSSYFCDDDVRKLVELSRRYDANHFLVLVDMDWQPVDDSGTVYARLMGALAPEAIALRQCYLTGD